MKTKEFIELGQQMLRSFQIGKTEEAKQLASEITEAGAKLYIDMTRLYLSEAVTKIKNAGDEAVACFAEGDELRVMLMGMKRFTKIDPVNTKELRQSIADVMIQENKFPYSLYN